LKLLTHHGGCHCRRVAFEVDAPADIEALDCNCSICSKTGFLHLIVPRSRFRLLRGEEELTDYRFNESIARHLFCRHCGIKSYYVPRSNPDGIDVNVRCLVRRAQLGRSRVGDRASVARVIRTRFTRDGPTRFRSIDPRSINPGSDHYALVVQQLFVTIHWHRQHFDAIETDARQDP